MMEESLFLVLGGNDTQIPGGGGSGGNLTTFPNGSSHQHPFLLATNHTPDVERLLTSLMGARRKDLTSVMALTLVYCLLFLTGVLGNVSTCIVIARNSYMHTVTNCYLFSLGVSDVLTLIFALPPELFSIWEAYPWQWGESFCLFKTFLMETTSYATVLTITGFTVERYLAICHPIRGQRSCSRARAVKCILSIWVLAASCALPYPIHTRLFYFVQDPRDGKPVADSLLCSIPVKWHERMRYVFQVSTFVFFVLPMGVISVMYVLIGMKLRRKEMLASCVIAQSQSAKTAAARARRAVLRMLVAVVVAFFLCWAPYHAQRLMTLYIQPHQWTEELLTVQSHLFYVSGVLYFLSSTVNPILYHVLSRKFRQAFKRTLCRCCLGLHVLPPFRKLQAKLAGGGGGGGRERLRPLQPRHPSQQRQTRPTPHAHLHPMKSLRVSKYSASLQDEARALMGGDGGGRRAPLGHQPSTMESEVRLSALQHHTNLPSASSSSSSSYSSATHAHSDGRLLALCRHRNCSCRRRGAVVGNAPAGCGRGRWRGERSGDVTEDDRRVVMSFPDVTPHRHRRNFRGYCHDVSAHDHHFEGDDEGVREICIL